VHFLSIKISHKLIVVGSCSHGIQDKVCWQRLFCLRGNSTAGARMPLDKQICLKCSHDK